MANAWIKKWPWAAGEGKTEKYFSKKKKNTFMYVYVLRRDRTHPDVLDAVQPFVPVLHLFCCTGSSRVTRRRKHLDASQTEKNY